MDANGADDILMGDRQRRKSDQGDRDIVDGIPVIIEKNLLLLTEHLPAQGRGSVALPGQSGELDAELAGQERAERFDDHDTALRS